VALVIDGFRRSPSGGQAEFQTEAAGQGNVEAIERADAHALQIANHLTKERDEVRQRAFWQFKLIGKRLSCLGVTGASASRPSTRSRDFAGGLARERGRQDRVGLYAWSSRPR